MKRFSVIVALLAATAVSVSAQQTPQPQTEVRQPMPGRANRAPLATNVRIDITINDQSGTGNQPVKKSISMLLADQSSGKVRSTGMVHQQTQFGLGPDGNPNIRLQPLFEVELNVDAHVELLNEDRLRTTITLEYTPGMSAVLPTQAQASRPSPLHESVTVIMQSGKPLVITQAADPLSDRKITVEVTATILR